LLFALHHAGPIHIGKPMNGNCLRQLCSQSYRGFELIAVDTPNRINHNKSTRRNWSGGYATNRLVFPFYSHPTLHALRRFGDLKYPTQTREDSPC